MMSTIASAMSGHHARCDRLFAVAEAKAAEGLWDEAVRAFTAFGAEFDRHLRAEETVLFPAFEAATGAVSGPTAVMRQEHERMRALLSQIELALAARDPDRIDDYASTLLILMQQHNVKEENVLYPMCDAALGSGAGELVARLDLGLAPA
ncbi:Hemerythrin HHE cation binding domain-containing protein [Burkholderiales bacterium]|nr:Hemerythrin HHE cation binding domain-containing protein [Burkholderiales bacterium]